ncbi:hypothetical protein E2C01_008164 [Portunus trituberculatus]|uniref:Uncharacterized protein n=1 Tax=Portunus trituberculatus TaxID=210409 RepID=A0A5B7D371_PORTR|nr:hypothetical protein [Portunus trituberculatus]
MFPCSFCLLFSDFNQLQKFMLGNKIVKIVVINLLASTDLSLCQ